MQISYTARLRAPKSVVVRTFNDGESVLLHLDSEHYFGLNATGTAMWSAIVAAPSVDEAYQSLLAVYEVPPETLRQDLEQLIHQLLNHRLVEVVSAEAL
jgi:hypothetical protein